MSVAKSAVVGDDLSLLSDAAVLNFGADEDVSLTHVADTGLLLNSSMQLQFGDSATYIHQSADGVLDLVADSEIEINATTIDMNGAVDASSTITAAGRVLVDDTTEATSTTDGSLQTDGGLSVAKSAVIGDDLDLLSNSAIFKVGNAEPFTLTHANSNNTLLASAGHRLAFGDAGDYITGDGTDISIVASGELKLEGKNKAVLAGNAGYALMVSASHPVDKGDAVTNYSLMPKFVIQGTDELGQLSEYSIAVSGGVLLAISV